MSDDELKGLGFEARDGRRYWWVRPVGGRRERFVTVSPGGVVSVENDANEWVAMYGVKTVADLRELLRLMGDVDE